MIHMYNITFQISMMHWTNIYFYEVMVDKFCNFFLLPSHYVASVQCLCCMLLWLNFCPRVCFHIIAIRSRIPLLYNIVYTGFHNHNHGTWTIKSLIRVDFPKWPFCTVTRSTKVTFQVRGSIIFVNANRDKVVSFCK